MQTMNGAVTRKKPASPKGRSVETRRRKPNLDHRAEITQSASQRRRATDHIGREQRPLAKLSKPVIGRVLPRPRLFDAIDRSEAKLVWVSGPPGAGKTTLLSTYVAARKSRSCGISSTAATTT